MLQLYIGVCVRMCVCVSVSLLSKDGPVVIDL